MGGFYKQAVRMFVDNFRIKLFSLQQVAFFQADFRLVEVFPNFVPGLFHFRALKLVCHKNTQDNSHHR